MERRRRAVYTEHQSGVRFVFLYDRQQPDSLHVVARHSVTPEEAIAAFLRGETSWNAANLRHETVTATHGLYWVWLPDEERTVLVFTCVRREGTD